MKIISVIVFVGLLGSAVASAQDPGLPDSLIVGNLDGSPILVDVNQVLTIPVWLKTDDSINFIHIPIASSDSFVISRDSGGTYPPFSLWDDVAFLTPNAHDTVWGPSHEIPPLIFGDTAIPPGYLSQSILGFAWMTDPEDPQNYLYTGYQWWHIADYYMTVSGNVNISGRVSCFFIGHNPWNGGLLCGIGGGIIEVIPNTRFGCFIISGFISGDANGSGSINGLDEIFLVNYIRGTGPAPDPLLRGDANGDCVVTGNDITYLVNYFLGRGPAPVRGDCR